VDRLGSFTVDMTLPNGLGDGTRPRRRTSSAARTALLRADARLRHGDQACLALMPIRKQRRLTTSGPGVTRPATRARDGTSIVMTTACAAAGVGATRTADTRSAQRARRPQPRRLQRGPRRRKARQLRSPSKIERFHRTFATGWANGQLYACGSARHNALRAESTTTTTTGPISRPGTGHRSVG